MKKERSVAQERVWKEALDLIEQAKKHQRLQNDERLLNKIYKQLKANPELIRSKATEEARLIHKLAKAVMRDRHQQIAFLRFNAYPEWLLCAQTTSEHNVVPSVLEHFVERFPQHIILIHDRRTQRNYLDTRRKDICLKNLKLNQPYASLVVFLRKELNQQLNDLDFIEEFNPDVWNIHYDAQFVKERRNRRLAQGFMPQYLARKFPEIQRDMQLINSGRKIRKIDEYLEKEEEK